MALPAIESFSGSSANVSDPPWKMNGSAPSIYLQRNGSGYGVPSINGHDCIEIWDADSFTNDQTSTIICGSTGSGSGQDYIYLYARVSGTRDSGSCYWFWSDGGSDTQLLVVNPSGNFGQAAVAIASNNSTTFTIGDIFSLSCIGSTISVTKNGVQIMSVSNTSVTGGSPGLGFYQDNAGAIKLLSWTGDNYPPTYKGDVGIGNTVYVPSTNGTPPFTLTSSSITTNANGSSFYVLGGGLNGGFDATAAVTDNKGNAYIPVGTYPFINPGLSSSLALTVWKKEFGTGGSGHTFSLKGDNSATYLSFWVVEVTNGDTRGIQDILVDWNNTATSPFSSTSTGTLKQSNELILAFEQDNRSITSSSTWLNGFTPILEETNIIHFTGALAYKKVSSTSSQTPSFNNVNAADASFLVLTFKGLTAPAAGQGPVKLYANGMFSANSFIESQTPSRMKIYSNNNVLLYNMVELSNPTPIARLYHANGTFTCAKFFENGS